MAPGIILNCAGDPKMEIPVWKSFDSVLVRKSSLEEMMNNLRLSYRAVPAWCILAVLIVHSVGVLNAQNQISFASDRTSRYQIFTVQISPLGTPFEVTTGGAGSQLSTEPDWSPSGKIAYQFGAPGVRGIHVINVDGTGDTQVTPPGSGSYPCTDDSEPAWSPDGNYIAYVCQNSGVFAIWQHNNNLPPNNPGSESLLFSLSKGLLFNPTWSRDGKSLAFVSSVPGNGQPQIQLYTTASKVLQPLTNSAFNDFDPAFSPDGLMIAFSSTRNGARQIFTMSVSCPETQSGCPAPVQLTMDPSGAQHTAWSSDGSWVAFASARVTTLNPAGKWQVYLLDPSAQKARRIQSWRSAMDLRMTIFRPGQGLLAWESIFRQLLVTWLMVSGPTCSRRAYKPWPFRGGVADLKTLAHKTSLWGMSMLRRTAPRPWAPMVHRTMDSQPARTCW